MARTVEDVMRLRPHFEQLPSQHVDSDLDFFLAVVRHRPHVTRPHVILLELAGGRAIRIVARIEERHTRIARLRRPLRVLQLAFGGIVGAESVADYDLAAQVLRSSLSEGEADVALLPRVALASPLHRAVQTGARWWSSQKLPSVFGHWYSEVPDSYDAFLKSRGKSTRAKLRQNSNRLERAHAEQLVVHKFTTPDDLSRLVTDTESVAARSYQRDLGVGYVGDELQRALLQLAAERGWLRAHVVYIADVPVAFALGYCYRGTYYQTSTAFDPAYRRHDVGMYVQLQMMHTLCDEPDVHAWDHGSGDGEHKRQLGDRRVEEAEVLVCAPTARAVVYDATRAARTGARRVGRAWIARTKLGARAKRAWRHRLARRASAAAERRG